MARIVSSRVSAPCLMPGKASKKRLLPDRATVSVLALGVTTGTGSESHSSNEASAIEQSRRLPFETPLCPFRAATRKRVDKGVKPRDEANSRPNRNNKRRISMCSAIPLTWTIAAAQVSNPITLSSRQYCTDGDFDLLELRIMIIMFAL